MRFVALMLVTGCAAVAAERASLGPGATQADASSLIADISGNGRYVLFASVADNLVPAPPSQGWYLRDRLLGTTTLALFMPSGALSLPDGIEARLSDDGSRLAVLGYDGGLVSSDQHLHVIVMDRSGTIAAAQDRSSVGALANADGRRPRLSRDGRYLAWQSTATNLTADPSGGPTSTTDVFWRDLVTGTTVCVSRDAGGRVDTGECQVGGISGDGRLVVFRSTSQTMKSLALPLPPVTAGYYVADLTSGRTHRLDQQVGGAVADRPAGDCVGISGDGRVAVFATAASNLVPGDTNGVSDIFVWDAHATPGTNPISRVSVSSSGAQANGPSYFASISDDGRYVVFTSDATNLVPGDTNGFRDVFVRDRLLGTTKRLSIGVGGAQANDTAAYQPMLSGDGHLAGWSSRATNLVLGDTNDAADAFVADTGAGFSIGPGPHLPPSFARLLELVLHQLGWRPIANG